MTPKQKKASPAPGWSGDLWGGLAAMLVALPSSIAFGVLVFTVMGPEHAGEGAIAGTIGAATLGLVAPLVGRNGGFITAPCAPAAAVLSGLATDLVVHGHLQPARIVGLMAVAALIAAGFQLLFGLLRLGRFIKYIPYQVVSGYLSGVAVIIAIGQVPKWLGLPPGVELLRGVLRPDLWQWPGIVVGATTIVAMAVAPRVTKRLPAAIVGLLVGIATYALIAAFVPALRVPTGNALVIGPIGASRPIWEVVAERASSLASVRVDEVALVFASALTLAVLLSIDTLKTGVVLDTLTRRRHNSNRELFAQGVANATSALVGGMPGAGTMGPTLVNVTSGGRSPLSGLVEGGLVVLVLLLFGQLVAWVPIGALAGVLMVVAFKMFDWSVFRLLLRPATRLDFVVIAAVIGVAEGVGLIQASLVGIVLAILLFIRDQVRLSVVLGKRDLHEVASKTRRLAAARRILDEHGGEGILVELGDNLFFGTTDQLFVELAEDLATRKYILFDLRRIQSMDYTAGHLFQRIQQQLSERGGRVLLSGMPSSHPSRQDVERYLTHLGLLGTDGGIPVHDTRNDALEWMEDRILEEHGWQARPEDAPLELGEIELFREFDAEAVQAIATIGEPVHVATGARIFSQGDEGDELYLIRRGSVEILLQLPAGKRHHVATMERGDYFGEMAFLDRNRRSADAEAKTETDLLVLSRRRFDKVAHAHPVVAVKVFARLALMVSLRLRSANAELRVLEQR